MSEEPEIEHKDNPFSLNHRPPTPMFGCLTFVGMLYHRESPSEEATSNEIRFNRNLNIQEQPYERKKLKVGEEWRPIDYGFLNDVPLSMILIKNEEGKGFQILPTEEEKAETLAKVLEVGYEGWDKGFQIPVGESHPFTPSDFKALRIRSLSGITRYSIAVIPG